MASSNSQTWHPVTPQIADPDLAPPLPAGPMAGAPPPGGPPGSGWGDPAGPKPAPQSWGFFADHKFAIIASVVMLVILIVILYVYLTRRGGDKKKGAAAPGAKDAKGGGQPLPGGPGGGLPENTDAGELNRLRAIRQQHRGGRSGQPPSLARVPTQQVRRAQQTQQAQQAQQVRDQHQRMSGSPAGAGAPYHGGRFVPSPDAFGSSGVGRQTIPAQRPPAPDEDQDDPVQPPASDEDPDNPEALATPGGGMRPSMPGNDQDASAEYSITNEALECIIGDLQGPPRGQGVATGAADADDASDNWT